MRPAVLHRVLVERCAQLMDAIPVPQSEHRGVVSGPRYVGAHPVEGAERLLRIGMPPFDSCLDPREWDDAFSVGRMEFAEHPIAVKRAAFAPLQLALFDPVGVDPPSRNRSGEAHMDDVPILKSGFLCLDRVEAATRFARRGTGQTHRFTLSGKRTLDGVQGRCGDSLGLGYHTLP
jgi:hypothetical protein